MSTILAIETSCDETAASVVCMNDSGIFALSNAISSQIPLHAPHGGVIPNLAAREHLRNFELVVSQALDDAEVFVDEIDAIAVTNAPGLIPALLVGTTVAKTLAWLWKKPLLGIHHIEGHIYANTLNAKREEKNAKRSTPSARRSTFNDFHFPVLTLVVSGGHTQLILMREHFQYEIVGETQDDAAGEAFDKVARILGLGYPGGPEVSKHAQLWRQKPHTESQYPNLPRPMLRSNNFHFSFSGLKTAVLYQVKRFREENNLAETDPLPEAFVHTICAEFENAAVEVLTTKTLKAAEHFDAKTILLAGGVSVNTHLRETLLHTMCENAPHIDCRLPEIIYTTDNAAMIGAAAALRWARMNESERSNAENSWKTLETLAESPISQHISST
jgi:N6-L-threonylcarbamoyladenine synthase